MALEGGDPTPLLPMVNPQSPFPQGHPASPRPGLVSPPRVFSLEGLHPSTLDVYYNSSKELSYCVAPLAGPVNCRQPLSPASLTLFSFGVPPQLLLQAGSGLSEGKSPAPTLSRTQVKVVTSTFVFLKKRTITIPGFGLSAYMGSQKPWNVGIIFAHFIGQKRTDPQP